ncbi:FUN14 family-domain-containing protein, partial [Chytriomyces sp. MP71]
LLGLCSGYAAKKISKGVALAIGAGFLALQGLAMTGVISINWKKIEEQVTKKLDFDGDGKLTVGDFKLVGLRFVHNLSRDLPSAGSFSAAFFLGFRYG